MLDCVCGLWVDGCSGKCVCLLLLCVLICALVFSLFRDAPNALSAAGKEATQVIESWGSANGKETADESGGAFKRRRGNKKLPTREREVSLCACRADA
eukprot:714463-Pleurochrysis_carterae.AAC.1